jgi:hypothetical protein
MSYTRKALRFTFSGADPAVPAAASSALVGTPGLATIVSAAGTAAASPFGSFTASGLRAIASIQSYSGPLGVQAQVKIWGLSMAQMNKYSTVIPSAINAELPNARLIIEAGDLGGNFSTVIDASIFQSSIDLTAVPDSAFSVSVAGIYAAANTNGAQSWQGPQNAEDLINALCAGTYVVHNNGAHEVLQNPSVPADSIINQVEDIASQAGFQWSWGLGNVLNIWPENGTIDDVVVDVGPSTDPEMVGYPVFWLLGLIITSLYNPEIQVGRQMNVVGSSLAKANGFWKIQNVRHELSTMLPNGPWFTTAILAAPGSMGT